MELTYAESDSKNENPRIYLNKTAGAIVPRTVDERYQFCCYLIDPNKYRLKKVLRILALVKRYIRNIKLGIKRRKGLNVDVEGKTCLKSIPREIKETDEESVGLNDSKLMSAFEYFY